MDLVDKVGETSAAADFEETPNASYGVVEKASLRYYATIYTRSCLWLGTLCVITITSQEDRLSELYCIEI